MSKAGGRAWVVSANMGYGHDRAAHGLEEISYGEFITSNDYHGIPKEDRKLWHDTRSLYEALSRLKPIPFIGEFAFQAMDRFQEIPSFYPRRDLSAPNLQLHAMYRIIKKGLAKDLCERLQKRRMPVVCTFPLTAHALEYHGYPEDIYVIVTDTDMSRAWVSLDPKRSKVKYFAPTGRVVERLKLYGVHSDRIFYTGFPIPKSIIGGETGPLVKEDLSRRICNLDPKGIFVNRYRHTLERELGLGHCEKIMRSKPKAITITFAVGGAGAQRHMGVDIAKSLREHIHRGKIKFILVAGTRKEVAEYFTSEITKYGLKKMIGKGIEVYFEPDRHKYFHGFDKVLRKTDLLWTKPSELSFYAGAGIPIIMAPPIGSQEEFNKLWILNVGAGIQMYEAETCNEWLMDWINSGALARMAYNGYIEAPTHGAYRIDSIITGEKVKLEELPLVV